MSDPTFVPALTPQEQAEMKLLLGERRAAVVLAAAQKLARPPEGELTGRQDPGVSGSGRALTQAVDPRRGGLERLSVDTLTKLALDPQVGAALEIIKLPILTIHPEFQHPDRVVREFLQSELDRVRLPLMRDLLTALEYGFVAAEKVFGYADRTIADPQGTVLWSARAVVYEKVKAIHPAGVQIDTGPQGERMGFKQIAGTLGKAAEVPEDKALIYTHGMEFGNRYGNPRTRRAYVPWWWQQLIYQFANRYFEDQSIPQRKIFYEPNPQPADPNDPNSPSTDPNQEAAARLAEESRAGAAAVLPLQAVQQPDGSLRYERGWDLEYLTGPNRQSEFTAYIDHLDLKKLRAMFVPEKIAATAATGGGAYNMVESLADFFLMSEEALLEELLQAIALSWARPLIDFNFGRDVPDATFAPAKLSNSNRAFLQDLFKSTILPPLLAGYGPAPQFDLEAIAAELKVPLKSASADTVRQSPTAPTPEGVDQTVRQAFPHRPRRPVRLEDIPGVRKPRYGRTWETMAAEFQQAVAEVYEAWVAQAARAIRGAPPEEAPVVLEAQLAELEARLLAAYRSDLPAAHGAGYGNAQTPRALAALAERLAQAEQTLKAEVMPALRQKLFADLIQAEVDPGELDGLIRIRMGTVTRSAGGEYWQTIVKGWIDRRKEQEAAGKATRIRWRLDNEASHCPDCVAWAGEYDSVDQLPAIPGDGTSQCGWNCRCWLEEYNPETGEWQRRITDFF